MASDPQVPFIPMPRLHEFARRPGRGCAAVLAIVVWCGAIPADFAGGEEAVTPVAKRPWMFSEANLPEGFPAPGPVNEVIVKTYPAHRLARARATGGANGLFMKLFRHIERNEIAMTAPVEMTWGEKEPVAMAFLYGDSTIGGAGADPRDPAVVVEDVPEIRVVSIGLRGGYDKPTFDRGLRELDRWLTAHPEWKAAGSPRTLGYNSPFVPNFAKYSEVQIPVAAAAADDGQTP